jgi:hypothetical protein
MNGLLSVDVVGSGTKVQVTGWKEVGGGGIG